MKNRHSLAGTEAEVAGFTGLCCGTEQHQGRKRNVSRCGTHWDLFPVLSFQPLCSSVQTKSVAVVQARGCPTAMERAAGPGALAQRLGRVLHPVAKTLKMVSDRESVKGF